ncbi:hypothetical protein [Xenorhabdus sp. KJ12.1]|uniref:hypothetical protein n=1 Tax=Xenorhabdus sp. KJ12.1 TaxID=1851571 RepID=UPI000C04A337|nr:hypothetical protein [Xenorhabdus sp. KJ12.1]PHM69155.1 hypothetical protein Xekj_02671 [Xenorhabdus sp. KJ12.1]
MNIDNNIVLSEKKEESSPIIVSIPDGADVIVGQHIYLVVTVKSPQVKSIKSITIDVPNNNIVVKKEEDWKLIDDTSGKAMFMLEIDDKLSSNTSISYTVHAYTDKNVDVEGIAPLIVNYTTKKVNEWGNSISLSPNMILIQLQQKSNPIDDPNSKYITYSGKLFDEDKNPLRNMQLAVLSASFGRPLFDVSITTDPVDGETPGLIDIKSIDNRDDFFIINSDGNGNVRFRVYPKEHHSVILELNTQILGMGYEIPLQTTYIIAGDISSPKLSAPRVIGMLAGGVIKKEKEDKKFRVYIPNYLNSSSRDAVIFLIKDENNNNITLGSTIIGEVNLSGYSFQLSYGKVPFNKKLGFYYIVLNIAADYAYSKKLNVIFEDDSGSGTNPNNGGNTGNGNHCDNGLYNKVDVDSNYEDGKFSLKIKSITLI